MPSRNGPAGRLCSGRANPCTTRRARFDAKRNREQPKRLACRVRARPIGLEPMTHGLEGRCSVHLSYGRRCVTMQAQRTMRRSQAAVGAPRVGALGFEPRTSCSQSRRANRAALRPVTSRREQKKLTVALNSVNAKWMIEADHGHEGQWRMVARARNARARWLRSFFRPDESCAKVAHRSGK